MPLLHTNLAFEDEYIHSITDAGRRAPSRNTVSHASTKRVCGKQTNYRNLQAIVPLKCAELWSLSNFQSRHTSIGPVASMYF